MRPVLFSLDLPVLGHITFPAYFTLLTIGFAFATLLTWRDAKRLDINPDKIIDINLWMVICAHARMVRSTRVKITGRMYLLAGIDSDHKRARALAALERSNLIEVHRQPGKAPVATVKLNKGNYPVPFAKASKS